MSSPQPNLPRQLRRFFLEYLPQQRNCSPHTVRSYRDALRLFLLYLRERKQVAPDGLALKDLSAETIMDFLNDLQESRHNGVDTRNARLAALRCFVRYLLWVEPTFAGDLQRVLAIPVKRTTRPMLDFLTREEMQAILDAPDEATWSGKRDRALFALMYNTGARVSEAVGAKVSDVTLAPGGAFRLHGKGRKDRVVPLSKKITRTLGKWIAGNHLREEQALFANARGAPLTRSGVEKRLREAVHRAGDKCPSLKTKRISPHTLRHTTAMHLLQSGSDITLIAMWLGHESIETTHAYITTDLEMKEKALQALQPSTGGGFRFRPKAALLTFLESL
jgi:site-specific recombinase XerD